MKDLHGQFFSSSQSLYMLVPKFSLIQFRNWMQFFVQCRKWNFLFPNHDHACFSPRVMIWDQFVSRYVIEFSTIELWERRHFNCSTDTLHLSSVQNIQVSTKPKSKKSHPHHDNFHRHHHINSTM